MSNGTVQKLVPGKCYHIYNRGNNKEAIFKEADNYSYFLSLWIKHIEPVAQTLCYCLLPNHFHFFIRIKDESQLQQLGDLAKADFHDQVTKNISKTFSNLFNAYAKSINKKYNRTGSLFQEQFKRKEVEDEANFTAIIAYVLANAAKHGFCTSVADYPYSSYQATVSDKPTRLLRSEVLEWFGGKEAFVQYINSYDFKKGEI